MIRVKNHQMAPTILVEAAWNIQMLVSFLINLHYWLFHYKIAVIFCSVTYWGSKYYIITTRIITLWPLCHGSIVI